MTLTSGRRRELLQALAALRDPSTDPAWDPHGFLPMAAHSLALRSEVMVIHGPRGNGKTAFVRFLMALKEKPDAITHSFPETLVASTSWLAGYSMRSPAHPAIAALEALPQRDESTLRLVWVAHLVCSLVQEGYAAAGDLQTLYDIWRQDRDNVSAWLAIAVQKASAVLSWLDRLAASLDRDVLVLYDDLDHIGIHDPSIRAAWTKALLALWLSLSGRYLKLRAKIFLREDIFQAARQSLKDDSRLRSRSLRLTWEREDLYRLLLRRMMHGSEALREWLKHSEFSLRHDEVLGYLPAKQVPEQGPGSQKSLGERLIGVVLVDGAKKSFTYRFLLNRLLDAEQRLAPSSLVNLISGAAEHALSVGPKAQGPHLLTQEDILAGLPLASRLRLAELQEEFPSVVRLRNLRGHATPLQRTSMDQLLEQPVAGVEDGFGEDGAAVREELRRAGVLIEWDGALFDVPDFYCYGLSIQRRFHP